jgi:RNA polymerase sigma factor (sigma-70 family)
LAKDFEYIIKQCIKGEVEFQQELYSFFADRMFALCMQYAKDYEEAKDLMQEGFIKVFNSLGQFRFKGSFEGWVRRIFVNNAIESFRSKKMKFSDMEIQNYAEDFSFDGIMDQIAAQDILNLVQELSPQYRLVFNLYAIEGYNHREIGELLKISEGTSKSNLSRARTILQEKIRNMMEVKVSSDKYHYS